MSQNIWPVVCLLVIGLGLGIALFLNRRRIQHLESQLDLITHRRKIVFDFLHDLGDAFTEGIRLDQVLTMIARFSVNTTQASAGAVFLFDRERQHLKSEVIIGPFPPPIHSADLMETWLSEDPGRLEQIVRSQVVSLNDGLLGQVARTGKPILIQDGLKDLRLHQYDDPALQIRTAIFMPLKFRHEVLGVMVVINKQSAEGDEPFNANDLFLLDSLSDHAAISLFNTSLYAMQAEKKQLDSDLRVAAEIQQTLLPTKAPTLANFDLAGLNHSAKEVGGDYFDFVPLGESRVGVIIADVSGKAVPGALVMTMCRTILRSQCTQSSSPAQVLHQLNELILPDLREDMFVTILYGILDGHKRTFRFARAGHDPALLYREDGKSVEALVTKGMAVGLSRNGEFSQNLEECELSLTSGDVLMLYTDGITESLNHQNTEFGRHELMDVIKSSSRASADTIAETVFNRLNKFTDNQPPADDRTLIVVKAR